MAFFLRVLLATALITHAALLAAQAGPQDDNSGQLVLAPVVIDGKTLFQLRGITSYPAHVRAATVRDRILRVARDRSIAPDSLTLKSGDDVTEIKAGEYTVLGVTDVDAEVEGIGRKLLAESYSARISMAITEFREDRSHERLLTNAGVALVTTLILALALWGVLRGYQFLARWSERRVQKSIEALAGKSYNLFHAGQMWRIFSAALKLLRLLLIAVIAYFYLNAVLGLFPWTRPLAVTLLSLVLTPLKAIGTGFVAALPDLFFLLVLILVVRAALKLIRAFFTGIHHRRIRFDSFDADWAMPTYKIIRILVIAFSVVIAYPYIPGSDSLAFKGVSVFLGVLLSLGSSSFIANTIAGLTMTYRGAFKEGDMVRIGDVVGRVDDIRLMVTRVITPKNETVILPNSNILNTDVINYSSRARKEGLMLHTTVGIGFDTPWRQVEALLLMAADRTEGILKKPPPFVLQKELGDYAVSYELNAACADEGQMLKLYSALHGNIQDVFNEHGVQIMSPRYVSDTEKPKIVPPENWYAAPAKPPE